MAAVGALLAFVAVVVVWGVAGALVHEAAHWVVWWLAGRQPELDVWALEVRPTAGQGNLLAPWSVQWYDRVAAAAPVLVGIVTLPALVVWPRYEFIVAWGVLTLGGARSDWATITAE